MKRVKEKIRAKSANKQGLCRWNKPTHHSRTEHRWQSTPHLASKGIRTLEAPSTGFRKREHGILPYGQTSSASEEGEGRNSARDTNGQSQLNKAWIRQEECIRTRQKRRYRDRAERKAGESIPGEEKHATACDLRRPWASGNLPAHDNYFGPTKNKACWARDQTNHLRNRQKDGETER